VALPTCAFRTREIAERALVLDWLVLLIILLLGANCKLGFCVFPMQAATLYGLLTMRTLNLGGH